MRIPRNAARLLALLIIVLTALSIAQPASATSRWPSSVKVIYVYDTSPRAWQVRQAAELWDNGSKLDLRYTRKGCRAGYTCVKVTALRMDPAAAGTTPTWSVGDRRVKSEVRLNTRYDHWSRSYKRAVSCHELGHAIGLDHYSSSGCMNWFSRSHSTWTQQRPTAGDKAALVRIYGKGR